MPFAVHTRVGAYYLNHFVLFAVFEQLLHDGRTRHATRPPRPRLVCTLYSVLCTLLGVLRDSRPVRQIAVIGQTRTQVRLMLTDHLKFQTLRPFYIRKVHKPILPELTGNERERGQ